MSPNFGKTLQNSVMVYLWFTCFLNWESWIFQLEENSQTYGSIVTSNWDKRVFAQQSLEYNLNDATFIELFPSIVKVSSFDARNCVKGKHDLDLVFDFS